MKQSIIGSVILIITILSFGCSAKAQDEANEVKRFRETRDKSFRNPAETPLTNADFPSFKGLEYYELSEKFIVKAKLEKTSDQQIFMMPTSNGASRKYFKYGVLTFEIEGKSFSLNAFQSETEAKKNTEIFVLFRDLTSGKETYGAGRYLNVKVPSNGEAVLDFNFAYNPSCAYGNSQYVCPLPPKENYLQTEIKAGEKVFPHFAEKQ